MLRLRLTLAAAALLAACTAQPTADSEEAGPAAPSRSDTPALNAIPPTEGPVLSHSLGAGCHGVEFVETVSLTTFVGTLSGDLVGTSRAEFLGGVYHGAVFVGAVLGVIDVTSSTVPGLAGKEIVYGPTHEAWVFGAPGLLPSTRVNQTGPVEGDGVTGHLTTHGDVDFSEPTASFTHRGNICVASG